MVSMRVRTRVEGAGRQSPQWQFNGVQESGVQIMSGKLEQLVVDLRAAQAHLEAANVDHAARAGELSAFITDARRREDVLIAAANELIARNREEVLRMEAESRERCDRQNRLARRASNAIAALVLHLADP